MADLKLPGRILKLGGVIGIDDPYIIIDLEVVKKVFVDELFRLR